MNQKIAFYTLGCKVNQYETNAMEEAFIKNGDQIVDFEEKADIYVVNTCTVTNMSDRKSRQILRRAKEVNPESILVVTGCYAQVSANELEKIEEIDLVLGNVEKKNIVNYVKEFSKEQKTKQIVTDIMREKKITEFEVTAYPTKTRAMIKIQDGCDQFCSYCIIPYARGRVRSRKVQEVVKEVEEIVKQGIKEIVITGIHIASYGKDFKPNISLITLLDRVSRIEGLERIRLGSLEPTLMKLEFLEQLIQLEKVCDHFHLSLQSGCNDTLQRMNRKYTREEFEQGMKYIRRFYPRVSLTTDVIVGFPGESEEEFEQTYEFLTRMKFYKMHVFQYSPRKGTKAASMENQIQANIKEQRSKKIIALSESKQLDKNKEQIGKIVKVLVEEKEGEYWKGHTTNYILTYIKVTGEENLVNQIVCVEITGTYQEGIIGRISKM